MNPLRRAFLTIKMIVQDAPIPCEWCHGTRIFAPELPMSCPRCHGSGKMHCRSGRPA